MAIHRALLFLVVFGVSTRAAPSDVNQCSVNNGGCRASETCVYQPVCVASTTPQPIPPTVDATDCSQLVALGYTKSGEYSLNIGGRPLTVYCDMETTSGGWTVVQRRQDGSVDFYRNWADYKKGFGAVSGEFWIGNDNLNLLTSSKRYKLRVELTQFDDKTEFAEFDSFKVESETDLYKLSSIGTYSGTAGDSLAYHLGQPFSTFDQDHDTDLLSCAKTSYGAWWYKQCHHANMNGRYYSVNTRNDDAIRWRSLNGLFNSLKACEMKIQPVN